MAIQCGTCGEKVRLIPTPEGNTIVCDYKPIRFNPGGGPHSFILSDGSRVYGKRDVNGTEKGYFRHSHKKAEAG